MRGSPRFTGFPHGGNHLPARERDTERKSGNGRKTACGVVMAAAGSGEAEPEVPWRRKGDIRVRQQEKTAWCGQCGVGGLPAGSVSPHTAPLRYCPPGPRTMTVSGDWALTEAVKYEGGPESGLQAGTTVSSSEGTFGDARARREDRVGRPREETAVAKPEQVLEHRLPPRPPKEPGPPASSPPLSSLPSCERTHFCSLRGPVAMVY